MHKLTDAQRHAMRHALGLTQRRDAYRNHYVTGIDSFSENEIWKPLVAAGLAWGGERRLDDWPNACFYVRRAGAEMVLLPGETIDSDVQLEPVDEG